MGDINFHYKPSAGLRNSHVQSLLSSSAVRRRLVRHRAAGVKAAEQELILDGGIDEEFGGEGGNPFSSVRLQAFWSCQPGGSEGGKARRVAVLFHGWEGSADSNYVLANAARLWAEGFDVLRFNFRDHGDTHHLNPGMFHSCRLDEVVQGLKDWQERLDIADWNLCGYSLGGNFALRVAMKAPGAGLNLNHVVAVCPVINPANAMRAMDESGWFYQRYFERKWSRSLRRKKELFPGLYGGDDMDRIRGLNNRTEYIATKYSGFESAAHYYNGYSIGDGRLAGLEVPATVLTSKDDPVIPAWDFDHLRPMSHIDLHIAAHGGHCGFLRNWKLESAAEDLIAYTFQHS
jgi:predicted alpha/beta-fold hydrolase